MKGRILYLPSVSTVILAPAARKASNPLFSKVTSSEISPSIVSVTVTGALQLMVYQVPAMVFSV